MADEDETNEDVNVKLLKKNRKNIVEALSHGHSKAWDEVFEKFSNVKQGGLNSEDCHQVQAQEIVEDKIRKCLDIVDGKGEESAKSFLNILYKLQHSFPHLGLWIKDYPGRNEESVNEAEKIIRGLQDGKLPFFLKMENSSLSEELWETFPDMCDAVEEAQLLPNFTLKDFEEFKRNTSNNRVNCLLDLIMEKGAGSFRCFCKILLQDDRMKVPMLKSINKLESGKNTTHTWRGLS
uniref:CARD domain-containing protein n=1 Tax=Eptatretus burgeri TaxID=7764 RepID=A0A8C4WVR5_EPTBU